MKYLLPITLIFLFFCTFPYHVKASSLQESNHESYNQSAHEVQASSFDIDQEDEQAYQKEWAMWIFLFINIFYLFNLTHSGYPHKHFLLVIVLPAFIISVGLFYNFEYALWSAFFHFCIFMALTFASRSKSGVAYLKQLKDRRKAKRSDRKENQTIFIFSNNREAYPQVNTRPSSRGIHAYSNSYRKEHTKSNNGKTS